MYQLFFSLLFTSCLDIVLAGHCLSCRALARSSANGILCLNSSAAEILLITAIMSFDQHLSAGSLQIIMVLFPCKYCKEKGNIMIRAGLVLQLIRLRWLDCCFKISRGGLKFLIPVLLLRPLWQAPRLFSSSAGENRKRTRRGGN